MSKVFEPKRRGSRGVTVFNSYFNVTSTSLAPLNSHFQLFRGSQAPLNSHFSHFRGSQELLKLSVYFIILLSFNKLFKVLMLLLRLKVVRQSISLRTMLRMFLIRLKVERLTRLQFVHIISFKGLKLFNCNTLACESNI